MIDFWNALPDAKLIRYKLKEKETEENEEGDEKEGALLELANNTSFIGNDKFGSSLFVRDCYEDFADITFDIINTQNNLVITGNPGIGMSFFLFFFMYIIRKREPEAAVIHYRHLEKNYYLYSQERIWIVSDNDKKNVEVIRKYLDKKDTWYLVDTAEPQYVKAKTLLVSSYHEHYHSFKKSNTLIRFMPVWSKQEIDFCLQV